MLTNENTQTPWSSAITYLNSVTGLSELKWSNGLAHSCQNHVLDIGPNGLTSHTGSNGSTFITRANEYVTFTALGENLAFGQYGLSDGMKVLA